MRIDHVIYAAEDLGAATARIERDVGAAARGGGRHEGHGTHNRIVPLGGGYIEVVGIADAREAAGSPFGAGVLRRLAAQGDGWLTWVVAVPDVEAVADRVGSPLTVLRRDGLSARLTGVAEAMHHHFLPFFISRDPGVHDPGAAGSVGGLTGLELVGDANRLNRWLGNADLPVVVTDGPGAVRAIQVGGRRVE